MSDTPPAAISDPDNHTQFLLKRTWHRMNSNNEHFMAVIVGREGSGKSHTALSICRMLDDGFAPSDVYFDPQQLLEAFDSEDYSAGDMVVLDEAGVGMGNRSWYEKSQILMNQTLQTVRDDNMGVIFTLPRLSELDSQTRGRFHAFLEMQDLYQSKGYATAKWKKVEPRRDERNDIYYPYPRLRIDGAERQIKRVAIGKPPESLASGYEDRKAAFKEELYEEAIDAYDDEDETDLDLNEIAQEIAEDGVEPYVSVNGSTKEPYINKDLIRVEYNLSHNDAAAVRDLLQKTTGESQLEAAV